MSSNQGDGFEFWLSPGWVDSIELL
jgi:hypothetical protein